MDQKLTGVNPLSYKGVNAYSPPDFVMHPRPPTSKDWRNFTIGCIWLDTTSSPPNNTDIWMLVSVAANVATWVQVGAPSPASQTITGDVGGAVGPDGANNINLFSGVIGLDFIGTPLTNTIVMETSTGEPLLQTLSDDVGTTVPADVLGNIQLEGTATQITTTSNPGANKIVFALAGEVANQYTTDAGIAAPAANNLNILGDGLSVSTSGAGDTITITSTTSGIDRLTTDDSNSAVPVLGNVNIFGAVGHIATTSAGDTVTIDTGSGVAVQVTTDDTNHATPVGGNLNLFQGDPGISTASAGDTLLLYTNGSNVCSFSVMFNGNLPNATGDNTHVRLPFNYAFFDTGSNFNLATHEFTAPRDGIYMFTGTFTLGNLGPVREIVGRMGSDFVPVGGTPPVQTQSNVCVTSDGDATIIGDGSFQETNTWIQKLTAGQKVYWQIAVYRNDGLKTVGIIGNDPTDPRTVFSGVLLI